MTKRDWELPLVKGGQGRRASDIEEDAIAVFWAIGLGMLLVVYLIFR